MYIIIGRVDIKISKVISFGFLGDSRHVISTPRLKIKTFNAYNLAYTRSFMVQKRALDSF